MRRRIKRTGRTSRAIESFLLAPLRETVPLLTPIRGRRGKNNLTGEQVCRRMTEENDEGNGLECSGDPVAVAACLRCVPNRARDTGAFFLLLLAKERNRGGDS